MEREIGGSTSSNVLLCRAVLCIVDYYVYGFVSIVISIFVRVFVELRNLNMEYCFFFFLFFFVYLNLIIYDASNIFCSERGIVGREGEGGIDYEEIVNYCRLSIWVKWVML